MYPLTQQRSRKEEQSSPRRNPIQLVSPTSTEAAQISTAMRLLAEIIASDVSLLVTFNHAIDGVIQNNPNARANPKRWRY